MARPAAVSCARRSRCSQPFLAALGPASILRLAYGVRPWRAPAHTVLVAEGDAGRDLHILADGAARVEAAPLEPSAALSGVSVRPGLEALSLGDIGPRDFMGAESALLGLPVQFSYVAVAGVTVYTVCAEEFGAIKRRVLPAMMEALVAPQVRARTCPCRVIPLPSHARTHTHTHAALNSAAPARIVVHA